MSTESKQQQIMCETCGRTIPPFQRAHDCDGGEALRKAAKELCSNVLPLIEKVLIKHGTGTLRGVFEIVYERDRLKSSHDELVRALERLASEVEGILPIDADGPVADAYDEARTALSRARGEQEKQG
jgi:hypothetical protein